MADWINTKQLLERWKCAQRTIFEAVSKKELKVYREENSFTDPIEVNAERFINRLDNPLAREAQRRAGLSDKEIQADHERSLLNYIFKIDDIISIEAENGNLGQPLGGKERTELGRLRQEKREWAESLRLAVCAGLYVSKTDGPIIRSELYDHLLHHDEKMKTTTFERVWDAIPEKHRSAGGRPTKKT